MRINDQQLQSEQSTSAFGHPNPAKARLIKRLLIKYCSRYGSQEERVELYKEIIKSHLDGKDQVSAEAFERIEEDII